MIVPSLMLLLMLFYKPWLERKMGGQKCKKYRTYWILLWGIDFLKSILWMSTNRYISWRMKYEDQPNPIWRFRDRRMFMVFKYNLKSPYMCVHMELIFLLNLWVKLVVNKFHILIFRRQEEKGFYSIHGAWPRFNWSRYEW